MLIFGVEGHEEFRFLRPHDSVVADEGRRDAYHFVAQVYCLGASLCAENAKINFLDVFSPL